MKATLPGGSRAVALLASLMLLNGCATLREFAPSVETTTLTPGEYIALKRGDILTTGKLGAATIETIGVAGLEVETCVPPSHTCIDALSSATGLVWERRQSALAELWLQQGAALAAARTPSSDTAAEFNAWMETARHAYAYLFFAARTPGQRAFEDRQTQVRDYYNYAVQEVAARLFERHRHAGSASPESIVEVGTWRLRIETFGSLPGDQIPSDLVPASSLAFSGLRSTYRRDGFGAELVAVTDPVPLAAIEPEERTEHRAEAPGPAWSEMPTPAVSALLAFPGTDAPQVRATQEATLTIHDPYRVSTVTLHDQQVPLAANFTAGYGLWLAKSGFNRQSLRNLLGREGGLVRPHVYLMQPYDPDRRIVLMIHGLASSPEAWVNVANELVGDEQLRQHFQIWQVYYPTNMPIALNHLLIRRAVADTLRHLDPDSGTAASRDMVIVGHSMGGVIARLMVSSSGDALWQTLIESRDLNETQRERTRQRLDPLLRFEPLPNVARAVFIAAPHRGTLAAGSRTGRAVARLIRLPLTLVESFHDVLQDLAEPDPSRKRPRRLPTGIDNLNEKDPFMQAIADLPISPRVRYHTIVAQSEPNLPLETSTDGLVPYRSAHLPGAASEKVIVSGHSVQNTAPAIIELRRILHQDIGDNPL